MANRRCRQRSFDGLACDRNVVAYLLAREFFGGEEGQWKTLLPLISVGIFLFKSECAVMQSTPMTETIFMASLLTSAYLLHHWVSRQTTRRLLVAAIAMTIGTLVRYEAWPVAALSILIVLLVSAGDWKLKIRNCAVFSAIVATGRSTGSGTTGLYTATRWNS